MLTLFAAQRVGNTNGVSGVKPSGTGSYLVSPIFAVRTGRNTAHVRDSDADQLDPLTLVLLVVGTFMLAGQWLPAVSLS